MYWIAALAWLVATWIRIYQQARFYQIEEYQSVRYTRWLLASPRRWLHWRMVAGLIGASVIFLLPQKAPPGMSFGISLAAAVVVGWPESVKEVKKAFRRTRRAMFIVVTAGVVAAVMMLAVTGALVEPVDNTVGAAITLWSLLVFIASPFWLIISNILMLPVESFFRWRFIQKARRIMKERQPIVIGITGSYGKTSTKVYLAHILNGRFKALPTPKSYNTLMGICTVINNTLAKDHSIEYFVVEMGAYIRGEIQRIAALTHPHISLVIEVGPQHLERFGSLENTAAAKYEIIKALPPDGVGIFNWDNTYVRAMYERGYPQTCIAISKSADPSAPIPNGPRFIASQIIESLDGLSFDVTDVSTGTREAFKTTLLGQHNVTNILMAAAVAVHEGMSLKEVARQVTGLQPAESRLVRTTTPQGITILNDAYSANPVGIIGSLQALGLHVTGKRLLITPGMVELGDLMEIENKKLGERAAQYATDVILVGEKQTRPIKEGLISAGFPQDHLHVVDTLTKAVTWYHQHLTAGDTVLFLNDLPDTYS